MIAQRFRILYLPEDRSTARQFNWTRTRFIAIACGSLCLTLFLAIGLGVLVARMSESFEQRSLRRENNLLMKEISELRYRIDELKTSMSSLEQTDNIIRVMVDLPPIDEDVRKVGIGGSVAKDYSRPTDPAQDLMLDLDKLEREIKLQRESFEHIQERIETNQDLILHTPSIWPVDGGRLTEYFGKRRDPFTHRIRPHYGIDIAAKRGTRVYATADGVIEEAKRKYAFGKVIIINHGYGFETVYGHLHSFSVTPGQKVKRGDLIGTIGNTGRSTGPHLHYEVRIDSNPVNPLDFMFEGYSFAR
jgi:hypothetical protein